MSKNGQLGKWLYRLFQDHRGSLKELYMDLDVVDRERLVSRIYRELNPDDEGAKLGLGTVEDLIERLMKHRALRAVAIDYLEAPIERLWGMLLPKTKIDSDQLNGYIDDDAFKAIQAIASPELARVPVNVMSDDEKLRFLGFFKSASDSISIGIRELKASMVSEE